MIFSTSFLLRECAEAPGKPGVILTGDGKWRILATRNGPANRTRACPVAAESCSVGQWARLRNGLIPTWASPTAPALPAQPGPGATRLSADAARGLCWLWAQTSHTHSSRKSHAAGAQRGTQEAIHVLNPIYLDLTLLHSPLRYADMAACYTFGPVGYANIAPCFPRIHRLQLIWYHSTLRIYVT